MVTLRLIGKMLEVVAADGTVCVYDCYVSRKEAKKTMMDVAHTASKMWSVTVIQ